MYATTCRTNVQGVVIQDSYNIKNDRGLSDFDARNRLVFNGIYELPLRGNRVKEGWELSGILTLQSGSLLTFLHQQPHPDGRRHGARHRHRSGSDWIHPVFERKRDVCRLY
jgi:hypothetical protein